MAEQLSSILMKLKAAHESGILTDEEYLKKLKQLQAAANQAKQKKEAQRQAAAAAAPAEPERYAAAGPASYAGPESCAAPIEPAPYAEPAEYIDPAYAGPAEYVRPAEPAGYPEPAVYAAEPEPVYAEDGAVEITEFLEAVGDDQPAGFEPAGGQEPEAYFEPEAPAVFVGQEAPAGYFEPAGGQEPEVYFEPEAPAVFTEPEAPAMFVSPEAPAGYEEGYAPFDPNAVYDAETPDGYGPDAAYDADIPGEYFDSEAPTVFFDPNGIPEGGVPERDVPDGSVPEGGFSDGGAADVSAADVTAEAEAAGAEIINAAPEQPGQLPEAVDAEAVDAEAVDVDAEPIIWPEDSAAAEQKEKRGRGFGGFWRRGKRNKIIIIAIAAIILAAAGFLAYQYFGEGGESWDDSDVESYEGWPETAAAKMLPEPPGTVTDAYSDTEDSLDAYVTCTVDEFKQYVEACKNAGFKNNIDESQEDEVQSFYAENDSNYGLFLDYYDGEMTISLASMEDYSYDVEADTEDGEAGDDAVIDEGDIGD